MNARAGSPKRERGRASRQPNPPPRVLVVDDDDDAQTAFAERLNMIGVSASVMHPQAVDIESITNSQLVLVDYLLERWIERDELNVVALNPRRGSSLIAVFRDQLDELHEQAAVPPVAFALRTLRIDKIPSRFPQPITQHAYARANNFEWVFDKEETATTPRRVAELAIAVQRLPPDWDTTTSELGPAAELLAVPDDQPWALDAVNDVIACHPPLHELSNASDGLAFLRWLLHRILPYPCFLYDEHRIAARLGIPLSAVTGQLEPGSSRLADALDSARYRGVLQSFLGPRWWRVGVESALWDLAQGNSFDPTTLRNLLAEYLHEVEGPAIRFPVLGLGGDYQYFDAPLELSASLRIQPDDWPPFAEDARTSQEAVELHPNLAAIVVDRADDDK